MLGRSRKLREAAEHFIDGSEKRICRSTFEFLSSHVIEKRSKCFSAGIYEDESGMMQCYAHFYIYLQIGIYSDLAMLCYYKVFYFRTLWFTPSINI